MSRRRGGNPIRSQGAGTTGIQKRAQSPVTLEGLELQRGRVVQFLSRSEEETIRLGEALADVLQPGDVVALFGELGSGKTRLVQGVCRGMGVAEDVTSPSFTLINEYSGRMPVYHFDFYRLERLEEIAALGIDEYFDGPGVCLIEWAERALPLLPEPRLDVHLDIFPEPGRENERLISIRWKGWE